MYITFSNLLSTLCCILLRPFLIDLTNKVILNVQKIVATCTQVPSRTGTHIRTCTWSHTHSSAWAALSFLSLKFSLISVKFWRAWQDGKNLKICVLILSIIKATILDTHGRIASWTRSGGFSISCSHNFLKFYVQQRLETGLKPVSWILRRIPNLDLLFILSKFRKQKPGTYPIKEI